MSLFKAVVEGVELFQENMKKTKQACPSGRRWNDPMERACITLQMRITESRKREYKKAAGSKSLTQWMFEQCDKAIK